MIDWSDPDLKQAIKLIGRVPVEALMKLDHRDVRGMLNDVDGAAWEAHRLVADYLYQKSVEKYINDTVLALDIRTDVIVCFSDGITTVPFLAIKPEEISTAMVAKWRKEYPKKMLTCYVMGTHFDLPAVIEPKSADKFYVEDEDERRMRDGNDEEWLDSEDECRRAVSYYFETGNYGKRFYIVNKRTGDREEVRDPDYEDHEFD